MHETQQNPTQCRQAQELEHPFLPGLEAGWLLIALLVPLWLNLWGQQPFDYAKVLLLRTIVWLMAGLWLLGWIRSSPRSTFTALRCNPLALPALALGSAWIIATWLSVDWRLSLYGSHARGQGLLTHLSYLLLFFIVAAELRRPDQARRLAAALGFTAVPVALLGAAQWIGLDPFGLASDARSPVYTTLGRPNFTGAYLAMVLPVTLALHHVGRRRFERWGWAGVVCAEVGAIVLTFARSAWLAAGVGMVFFLALQRWPSLGRRARHTLLAATGAAAAMGLSGAAIRLTQAQEGSLAARVTIWQATVELIRQRPWFGHGLDTLEMVFPRVYPPQLVYYQGRESFVDRAHNLFLDWMATAGGLGLVAGLILFGAFFVVGLRRVADSGRIQPAGQAILAMGALAAVAANLVGNLASFDVTATATATWLLLGLVAAPVLATGENTLAGLPPQVWSGARREETGPARRIMAATVITALVVAAIVQFNLRALGADVMHRAAALHASAGRWQAAEQSAQRAILYWSSGIEHHRLLGDLFLQAARVGAMPAHEALPAAEAAYLAAINLRPLDPVAWIALGDFHRIGGTHIAPEQLEAAHHAYARALRLAPQSASIHLAWGQVYLAQAQPDQALAHFRRAVDLDATYGEAYRLMGDVLRVHGGEEADVLEAYHQAIHWSPALSHAYLGLGAAYWKFGHMHAANQALAQAQRLDPGNPAILALQHQVSMGLSTEDSPAPEGTNELSQ